jgi:hypothetical protein
MAIVAAFTLFTVCFVAIPLTSRAYSWTTLSEYVAYATTTNQFFHNLARLTMLIFGPLWVVLLNCIYDYAAPEQRFLARLSLCFGVMFAVLTGINYFTQLSAVRLSIAHGHTVGLEQVVQANPWSAISAVNILGWSVGLGLSSLFAAPVFSGSKVERLIRFALLLNGIFCLLGGLGYALDIVILVFWTLNFGMGGAVLTAAIALTVLFRQMARQLATLER